MTHQPPASQFAAPNSTGALLQEIHDEINALGGDGSRDAIGRAINETVTKALDIIEAKQRELAQ